MKSDLHALLTDFAVVEHGAAGGRSLEAGDPTVAPAPVEESLAAWAEARVAPLAVPVVGSREPWRRLLATLGSVERFRPFFDRLRGILGLDEAGLRATLALLEQPGGWLGDDGLTFRDFAPGSGSGVSAAGLIRVAAGVTFPRHTHLGREVGCVLEGELLLEGRCYRPGDVLVSEAGSAHQFSAGPGRDLVLVVAHGGISFG